MMKKFSGYASCFTYSTWSDDWPEKVEKFLFPHANEAAVLEMIVQDLVSWLRPTEQRRWSTQKDGSTPRKPVGG